MTRSVLVMLAICAAMLIVSASADPVRAQQRMMKGVELYSWKDDAGNWRYALLPGTNRQKTQGEIVAAGVSVKDVAALKQRLAAMAVGEQVFWLDLDELGFSLPDPAIVAEVVTYARMLQVTVEVLQ